MTLKRKIGERWIDGASYWKAFLMAYAKVATNMKLLSEESATTKMVALPLYSLFIVFYSTLVPLYPILQTQREAEKMKEAIIETVVLSCEEMEEYLEPIEDAIEPPFEFMMIKARQEESYELRKTVVKRV